MAYVIMQSAGDVEAYTKVYIESDVGVSHQVASDAVLRINGNLQRIADLEAKIRTLESEVKAKDEYIDSLEGEL